jgi:hypothetical protein
MPKASGTGSIGGIIAAIVASTMTLALMLGQVGEIYGAARQAKALPDPIPAKIQKSDIVVRADAFVRAPRTSDSNDGRAVSFGRTNPAYARIQYLVPVGDGSGRLVLNDLRGLLYMIDARGEALTTFLDVRTQNVGFDDSMFPN